jgi:hypothetical protein
VRRATALLLLLIPVSLCACAPKPQPPAFAPITLDCAMPFDVQSAKITAQPHLLPASHAPGEPYFFYSTDDGRASYLITEKGAPGHPAIMMQTAAGGQVKTVGCAYGDKKGYNQLLAYLDSLKTWTRR